MEAAVHSLVPPVHVDVVAKAHEPLTAVPRRMEKSTFKRENLVVDFIKGVLIIPLPNFICQGKTHAAKNR